MFKFLRIWLTVCFMSACVPKALKYYWTIDIETTTAYVDSNDIVYAAINFDGNHQGVPDWSNSLTVKNGVVTVTSENLNIWLYDVSWNELTLEIGDTIEIVFYCSPESYFDDITAGKTTVEITNYKRHKAPPPAPPEGVIETVPCNQEMENQND